MRHIIAEGAVSLNDAVVADADELVKHSTAAKETVVANLNMPRKEHGIGDDIFVSDVNIVSEMAADHEEVSSA